jgi:hypothetical protein
VPTQPPPSDALNPMQWLWICGWLVGAGSLLCIGALFGVRLGIMDCARKNRCALYAERKMAPWRERLRQYLRSRPRVQQAECPDTPAPRS